VVVSNDEASSGDLVAWALVEDRSTGDNWAVVDWARFHGLSDGDAQRIPVVIREGGTPSRRRPVHRPSTGSSALQSSSGGMSTSVALFNPGTESATVRLTYWSSGSGSETTISLAARETERIDDVVTFVRGGSGRSLGYLVITPVRGRVAVSARIERAAAEAGTLGAGVPALPATSGLRLGQSRGFAGLQDSTQATIVAGLGGTMRTTIGFAELAGASVTVRASLRGFGGGLVAGTVARDFDVGARSVVLIEDMARAILGSQRDTVLGDLRNLQLELRVVGGTGAATVFVMATDNASADPILRLE
jgi:hypothetical protein